MYDILLVDDDPIVIAALGRVLQGLGRLRFATNGADALRMARLEPPDLVLLDIEMPGMDGFEVCALLKADPLLTAVPVLFITSHEGEAHEVRGFELGAADFIAKPPRAAQVQARVRMHLRMKQMADELRDAAYLDALTGIANRRQLEATLQREWLRAQRVAAPMALLMIDIDLFKAYNDHYGHPAGDACLQRVAQTLRGAVHRPADLAARYGGEEFVLLLPETDACGARFLALEVLRAVEALGIPHARSDVAGHVTLSIGVSAWDRPGAMTAAGRAVAGPSVAHLLTAADEALYVAKRAGRRRVCFLAAEDAGHPERALDLQRAELGAVFELGALVPAPC